MIWCQIMVYLYNQFIDCIAAAVIQSSVIVIEGHWSFVLHTHTYRICFIKSTNFRVGYNVFYLLKTNRKSFASGSAVENSQKVFDIRKFKEAIGL